MSGTLAAHFALAFVLTQAIECPIYLRAMPGVARSRALAIAFGASALTHPVVALVIPGVWSRFAPPPYWAPGETALDAMFVVRAAAFLVVAEGFAVLAEALYLGLFGVARPLFWSLVANGTSAAIGAVLTLATGWP